MRALNSSASGAEREKYQKSMSKSRWVDQQRKSATAAMAAYYRYNGSFLKSHRMNLIIMFLCDRRGKGSPALSDGSGRRR